MFVPIFDFINIIPRIKVLGKPCNWFQDEIIIVNFHVQVRIDTSNQRQTNNTAAFKSDITLYSSSDKRTVFNFYFVVYHKGTAL